MGAIAFDLEPPQSIPWASYGATLSTKNNGPFLITIKPRDKIKKN